MDLLRWYRTTQGMKYANSVCNAMLGVEVRTDDDFGAKLHNVILIDSLTYAVASDICHVVEAAATTIPSFAIQPSDLPSSGGFVFFEHPLLMKDDTGKNLVVKAIAWHLARPSTDVDTIKIIENKRGANVFENEGIIMILWTVPSDPRDHMHEDWVESAETRASVGVSWPSYLSMVGGTWNFGDEPRGEIAKVLLTFLRFIQERWVDNRQVIADRHAIKRAKRVRPAEPVIKIIRLRRAAPKKQREGDPEQIEWSRRWIVHPHWRNQWYPSLGVHRPRYIPAYIKGPDDKPLIVDDTVFVVDR
jgi:hypothetical protein